MISKNKEVPFFKKKTANIIKASQHKKREAS